MQPAAAQALVDPAREQLAPRAALRLAQGRAWAVDQWEPAQVAAKVVEHRAAKVRTLAQNRAGELSSEERGQAQLGAEGHAEAVPAAWAQAALAAGARRAAHVDRATQEAAFRLGPPKTKTSWEF